jgi:DNA-binding IclR family transcriptional regulator
MPRTGKPAARHVAAVERAIALLGALEEGGEMGTNELARRAGLNPSTVSRLLATLAAAGLVERVAESGRYRLGLRLVQLGNVVLGRLDLRETARPRLQQLSETTGETTTLSAPARPDAVTIDFVQSPASVQSVAHVGRPSVAHATAAGKVMRAFGPDEPPRGPLTRYTRRTITDPRALAREIAHVRAQGWAGARGEREADLNALAAPVFGSGGELVAIVGVQGPASRFDEPGMERALEPLLDAAAAVSHALGWRPPDEEEVA